MTFAFGLSFNEIFLLLVIFVVLVIAFLLFALIRKIGSKKKAQYEREAVQLANQQAASTVDEILKYKNLLDQGAMTQEEFDAKKKQLLGL